MMHRHAPIVLGLLALAVAVSGSEPPASGEPPVDPQRALHEGNRLFRDGRVEAAVEAYLAGHAPGSPHPTLIYNLGTALHHLERLPEAVLWYRRAGDVADPWLTDNLWLARRGLGSQILPAGGWLGRLGRHVDALQLAAVAVGWAVLLLVIARPRTSGWLLLAAALTAGSLYGAGAAVERWGPRPAVLVQDCFTPDAELPAGTEAWVRPAADGRWSISGTSGVSCPPETVELVFPDFATSGSF